MAEGDRPPLHRLTMLRDDPAARWLSPWSRLQVAVAGLSLPAPSTTVTGLGFIVATYAEGSRRTPPASGDHTLFLVAVLGLVVLSCLSPTIYWASLQIRSRALLALVRMGVVAEALALDDWSTLASALPLPLLVYALPAARRREAAG